MKSLILFIWCKNCKKNFKLIAFLKTKQLNFITENLFTCHKTSGNRTLKYDIGKVAEALIGPKDVESKLTSHNMIWVVL